VNPRIERIADRIGWGVAWFTVLYLGGHVLWYLLR
jgi:hypothetical protein